jgi:glyoxylase-like metal-dependent hydrolase (beta-lactamase superfamily II)
MSTDLTESSTQSEDRDEPVRTIVYTSPTHELVGGRGTFSPTTATLVAGRSESVLIDAQYMRADIEALGDLVERSGTTLTAIYVTHGHGDHYFGIGKLLERFPGARPIATAAVVEYIESTRESQTAQWQAMFGDGAVTPTVLPEAMVRTSIELEGIELNVIEVGQGDIKPSTVVHIPAIDTVIAGDVIYNEIHAMLGFAGRDGWRDWISSIDQVEHLAPRVIVAGHKKPDASDWAVKEMLDGTRSYIEDFVDAAEQAGDAKQLEAAVLAKYPDLGNPWTLRFSAHAWFPG